jgi:hypothetical protein
MRRNFGPYQNHNEGSPQSLSKSRRSTSRYLIGSNSGKKPSPDRSTSQKHEESIQNPNPYQLARPRPQKTYETAKLLITTPQISESVHLATLPHKAYIQSLSSYQLLFELIDLFLYENPFQSDESYQQYFSQFFQEGKQIELSIDINKGDFRSYKILILKGEAILSRLADYKILKIILGRAINYFENILNFTERNYESYILKVIEHQWGQYASLRSLGQGHPSKSDLLAIGSTKNEDLGFSSLCMRSTDRLPMLEGSIPSKDTENFGQGLSTDNFYIQISGNACGQKSADRPPVVGVNSFENRYKLASQSRRGLLKSDIGVSPLESRKPFRESMGNLDRAKIGRKKEKTGKVLNEISLNIRNCDDWNSKQLVESVLIHESYESKHNGVCKTMTRTYSAEKKNFSQIFSRDANPKSQVERKCIRPSGTVGKLANDLKNFVYKDKTPNQPFSRSHSFLDNKRQSSSSKVQKNMVKKIDICMKFEAKPSSDSRKSADLLEDIKIMKNFGYQRSEVNDTKLVGEKLTENFLKSEMPVLQSTEKSDPIKIIKNISVEKDFTMDQRRTHEEKSIKKTLKKPSNTSSQHLA